MSEHNPLIPSTAIHHAVEDFWALGVDYIANFCGVVIESHGIVVVADALEDLLGDVGVIHVGVGCNFTGDEQQPCGDKAFAGHFGVRILGQIRIKDGI